MGELLLDSWEAAVDDNKCCHQKRSPKCGPVHDVHIWVECFSTLVAVLASKFPHKTTQFMAYQRIIVRASRYFTGDGWQVYDSILWRKAAACKSLDWGQIGFTTYNELFTGRAKVPQVVTQSNTKQGKQEVPLCKLYNSKSGNRFRYNPCRYQHLCSECSRLHPAGSCWKKAQSYKSPPPESQRYHK